LPTAPHHSSKSPDPIDPSLLVAARDHLDDGQRYEQAGACARAISAYRAALDSGATIAEQAEAHLRIARVHRSLAEWDDAIAESREAVRLADAAGSDDLAAEAMNVEVGVHQLRGDFDAGHALAERAIARARTPRIRGILLQNRGAMAARAGDFTRAEELFSQSVQAFREADYQLGMAIALNNAAAAACDGGDPARALELGRDAAAIAYRLEAFDVLILALQNQAQALVELDRTDEAEAMLWHTLGHFVTTENVLRQAECLEILGRLHARRPAFRDEAVKLFERAASLAASVGDRGLCERVAGRLGELGAADRAACTPDDASGA
jgi:tetratricopeptide (TPR) repeat protein